MPEASETWWVYILACADGSFYTGICRDVERRVARHSHGTAAAWTRKRRPVRLVFTEQHPTKSAARCRELEIKG